MESYLDSSHQVNVPSSAHSRMAGGLTKSSASSGIFFQGDGQSQILVNSHLYPSYGNSSNSERPNMCMISEETYKPMLNNISNSGPSVGASSLVTDANSAFSGGPQLQRSASINTESYMRLPASPMSFSSNNISISGSSVVDGSTMVQKNSKHDTGVQQQQGASSATSLHTLQANQVPFPMGSRLPGSFIQDSNNISHVQKKPRLDVKQDDILQQQVLQQVFQRQDPMQLRGQNPQMQFLLQQQRLRQQQQILQSMPPLQRLQLQQQQQQQHQQLQLRQQLQQQFSGVKRPHETGVCARRLMQYLYHQRQRPHDNSIVYWRKFVSEYYSTRAKKRWCLSLYDNVGQQALGVFPQAAADAWHCDICGSKSGRGFEASFEVLPRLNEIKFGSGVIDELLFLDMPRECRLPSGIMILEYGKAVQESVYEQLRVVREGHLRIIFSQDLKILSWEFCARRHEELLPRRSVAPQVNQLLQVAQKCQSTISESGSDGVPQQDLQTNSNMVLTAGRQLAKSLELQSLNDLGFSKRYVRCLQISEVVNSMKDLIDFCRDHKSGPIEGLKSYPRHSNASKLQMQRMQELEQLASAQGLPTDRNTLNKLMALHSGVNISMSNPCNHTVNHGAQSGSAQTPFASANYQNMLIRQNSITTNQSPSSSTLSPGGFSSPYLPPQHQMQLCSLSTSHQQPLNADQALQQQQMMQQLYQDMSNNSGNGQRQSFPAQNQNILNMGRNPNGFGQNSSAATPTASNVSETAGYRPSPSQNNSLNTASNNDTSSSVADSNNGLNQFQNIASQEGMLPDISHEFTGTEFFNSDLDDNNLGYTWKD